jgi:hypothetical protein
VAFAWLIAVTVFFAGVGKAAAGFGALDLLRDLIGAGLIPLSTEGDAAFEFGIERRVGLSDGKR